MGLSKSLRVLYVWEAVEQLKVATSLDVLRTIASRIQEDPENPNLKRSIYRDLKQLADSGQIGARYLSSDGTEIEPEEWDQLKGGRLEYFSRESDAQSDIRGIHFLEEAGGAFIPATRDLEWQADKFKALAPKKISLVVKGNGGQFYTLSLPLDMRPARFLVTRVGANRFEHQLLAEEAREQLGPRTASFFAWDKSVSRHQLGQRLGHAHLAFAANGTINLSDLKSTTGTAFVQLSAAQLVRFVDYNRMDRTMPLDSDIFENEFVWQDAPSSGVEILSPCLIKMGNFRILLVC